LVSADDDDIYTCGAAAAASALGFVGVGWTARDRAATLQSVDLDAEGDGCVFAIKVQDTECVARRLAPRRAARTPAFHSISRRETRRGPAFSVAPSRARRFLANDRRRATAALPDRAPVRVGGSTARRRGGLPPRAPFARALALVARNRNRADGWPATASSCAGTS
jgi:hypothetical protein